jgi:simple sugar transport system ATP-binding protein
MSPPAILDTHDRQVTVTPLLEIQGLTKRFSRVTANDDVSLSVASGEIRALLGENGAGKSTLMSCLYGLYTMDAGAILMNGSKVNITSCQDAMKLGIGMVNQHFMLVQKLTVTENVILGLQTPGPWVDYDGATRRIRELSERYHFCLDPDSRIEDLPVGLQQRVEILKILYRHSTIMIFDEPTAVLTPNEVLEFFGILRKFKEEGRTILLITHKLNEVMKVCDSVTVLRDGKVVGNVLVADTSEAELARMMVGRSVFLKPAESTRAVGDVVLKVQSLRVKGSMGLDAVKGISFEIRAGEILGIAGVDGNGQLELGNAITGMAHASGGRVEIMGIDATNQKPARLHALGISHIPPDRQKTGLILDFSAQDNLAIKDIGRRRFSRWGYIRRKAVREHAERLICSYNIRGCGPETAIRQLSGGNQQKVILAREFEQKPRLIIAIQPTRGLDISAIEFVRAELVRNRDAGAAVLLISTELDEILSLSDRIEVIYEGTLSGSFPGHRVDPLEMGLLMAGRGKPAVCEDSNEVRP